MILKPSEELEYLMSLEGKVFEDIDGHHIKEEETDGVIYIPCPDGRFFPDIFTHHCEIQRSSCRGKPLIHPLPRHGGVAILAPASPFVPNGSTLQEDLLREIGQALTWIGYRKIAGSVHGGAKRCGMATHSKLPIKQLLNDMFKGSEVIRNFFIKEQPKVSAFCHVDYGENYRRYGKKNRVLSWYASQEGWAKANV